MGTEATPLRDRLGLSVEEFARAIGVSRNAAYQAVWAGVVPHRRLGRRVIVPVSAIERWLESPEETETGNASPESDEREGVVGQMPDLVSGSFFDACMPTGTLVNHLPDGREVHCVGDQWIVRNSDGAEEPLRDDHITPKQHAFWATVTGPALSCGRLPARKGGGHDETQDGH